MEEFRFTFKPLTLSSVPSALIDAFGISFKRASIVSVLVLALMLSPNGNERRIEPPYPQMDRR
jgi:hypothetical protein